MKRKIALILLVMIVLAGGAILYLNSVYLPAKIRSIITVSLARQLNARIILEELKYSFSKGIVIRNLAVFPADSTGSKPVFSAAEVSFQVLYLPILKNKNIIIPSLKIDGATVNITRFPDGNWNFRALNLNPAAKSEFLFLVYQSNLTRAKIFFEDYGVAEPFLTEIPELKAKANLALPKNVKFILEAKLAKETASGVLLVNGNFDLAQNRLAAKINLHNFNPLVFKPYLDLPFALNTAKVREAQAEISFDNDGLRLHSRLACEAIDLAKDSLRLNTDTLINLQMQNQTFNATAEVFNAALTGLSLLEEISAIKGKLTINPQEVNIEELQGVSRGVALSATGRIFNFASPQIAIKVFTGPTVEKLVEIFADSLSRWDFAAKGKTQLVLNFSGALSQPAFSASAEITNAELDAPQLKSPIKEINGKVEFDQNSASWEKLSFVYAGNTFVSSGTLEDFDQPSLELALGSKTLSLSTKLDIFNDSLSFSQLDGKYLNSVFSITGKTELSDPDNPWLDLTGRLALNLKDLKEILPDFENGLRGLDPAGILNIQGSLRGYLKNRRLWQLDLTAESQRITLRGLKLNALTSRLNQPEKNVNALSLRAEAYAGTLEVLSKIFLAEDELPVEVSTDIRELDLALLKLDTPFKDKPTAGKLTALFHLRCPAKNIRAMNGSGSFSITNGNLWEINLLKGLGAFLFIPEFQKIVLEEASADFTVSDGKIYTSNLEAKSKDIDLSAEGELDLSGKINLLVTAMINPDLIQSSASLKKFITSALTSANGALAIRISGELQNPKYTIIPATMDIIRRAKEFFLEDILR